MPKPIVKKPTKIKTTPYDVAEHLRTPAEMAAYLDAWFEEARDDTVGRAKALQSASQAFEVLAHRHPVTNESEYDRMVLLMNALLDETGDDDEHPLSGLLDRVSDLVSRYEQVHHAISPADSSTP